MRPHTSSLTNPHSKKLKQRKAREASDSPGLHDAQDANKFPAEQSLELPVGGKSEPSKSIFQRPE